MISTIFRNRKTNSHKFKNQLQLQQMMNMDQLIVPNHFLCPISLDLMKDPVTLPTGITFDRESIEKWIEAGNLTCPVTNQVLTNNPDLIPNHVLRRMIQDWCVTNYRYGIQRIPTPRIPVTQTQVAEILSTLSTASQRLDHSGCRKLLEKIRNLGKESERNKRCFVTNGTGVVLSAAFNTFALASFDDHDKHRGIMEELMAVLMAWPAQVNSDALLFLGSKASFNGLLQILMRENSDLSGRRNTALALKKLLCSDQKHVEYLASETDQKGAMETLFKLIKEPICPTTTKACLTIIFYLVSSSARKQKVKLRFVEMGLVSLLLETLVDAEKGLVETCLGVLDELCDCDEGREKARGHPLAIPVVVKKLHRVSDLATEFAVSVLWKLLKFNVGNDDEMEGGDGGVMEALQVGAFQKLLLLLQVGCGQAAKGKATKLLKLIHSSQSRLECSNLTDFKKLKIPF